MHSNLGGNIDLYFNEYVDLIWLLFTQLPLRSAPIHNSIIIKMIAAGLPGEAKLGSMAHRFVIVFAKDVS